MSKLQFHLPDEPSDLSVGKLVLSLRSDCQNKAVSPKNYAHRARVIRQQSELLAHAERSGTAHSSSDHCTIRPDECGNDDGLKPATSYSPESARPRLAHGSLIELSGHERDSDATDIRPELSPAGEKHRKSFTIFRSAAEEAETSAAHDVMDNEGPCVRG